MTNEYDDIHSTLVSFEEAFTFFEQLERDDAVKSYCNGANKSGRWIFQIYNHEFISELAAVIAASLEATNNAAPILEVMCGDGRLSEFLQPYVDNQLIATDAKDGRYNIAYPKWVETLDALDSVSRYDPSLVLISWEPYLSMTGLEIIRTRVPTIWIGNPEMCGHPDIFEPPHIALRSCYALSRHDSFVKRDFKTDIFLFNIDSDWLQA